MFEFFVGFWFVRNRYVIEYLIIEEDLFFFSNKELVNILFILFFLIIIEIFCDWNIVLVL